MTEIAKCVCGAEAKCHGNDAMGYWAECKNPSQSCWWSPSRPTKAEALQEWERVMSRALTDERPRPVVKLEHREGVGLVAHCCNAVMGTVEKSIGGDHFALNNATVSDGFTTGTRDDCRAWLITKLRDSGFDVQEAK